jgi:Uma2 family endonuclease
MQAAHPFAPAELLRAVEGRIILRGLRWQHYEALVEAREPKSWPRIVYLDGEIELMAQSGDHESIKKTVARLLEAYAEEADLALNGIGSATLKRRIKQAGAEPDESYSIGPIGRMPQLAIEIAWSRGALNKLEVYRRLGVGEVWIWSKGALEVHVLRGARYVRAKHSALFPDLDLDRLVEFVDTNDQTGAVKRWRRALRASRRAGRRRPSH